MGDVDVETAPALEGEGGRYSAVVHQDWEIWGPCGGYVAAIALRAAGAESPFARPASFFCHYLSVAAFEPVDLVVTPLRSGRTVLAQRVEMTQGGRAVLEAMVWSVGEVAGLEHQDAAAPDVAGPDAVPVRNMGPPPDDEDRQPDYRFWDNFEQRPLEWIDDVAAARTASADVEDLGALPRDRARWTTRGPTPPAWWSCSTSAAGRPAIAPTRIASMASSRPASICTRRSRTPAARPGGSSSTPTRRWHRTACSRGPAASGPSGAR